MRRHLSAVIARMGLTIASALLPLAVAQTSTGPAEVPKVHLDLILVIDTSGSMEGAGGAPVIFPQVKEAAKQLISWCETGDNVVLITYDTTTTLRPTVVIYGEEDKESLRKLIDPLRARGQWTYTADALANAFREARRLEDAQTNNSETPHTKVIMLLTDGINSPPPEARNTQVSLSAIAKQYAGMPWFLWQVQLGTQIDKVVEQAFRSALPNYNSLQEPGAKALMEQIRKNVIQRLQEEKRKAAPPDLRMEPARLDFGTIRPGDQKTLEVHLIPNRPVSCQIRFNAEGAPEGLQFSFDPAAVAIAGSEQQTVAISVKVGPSARERSLSNRIGAQVVGGTFRVEPRFLSWTAYVHVPTSPWKVAAGISAALGSVGLLIFLFVWLRRPLLYGTLRYWMPGSPALTADLGSYRKRQVRMGGKAGCVVLLRGAPNKAATLTVSRIDGIPLCILEADGDTSIQFQGQKQSRIELYNRDQFQFENYTIEYRGEAPDRPKSR